MKKFKLPKKYWEKGKSKFLELRPELQHKPDFTVSQKFKDEEAATIKANRERRFKKYGHY